MHKKCNELITPCLRRMNDVVLDSNGWIDWQKFGHFTLELEKPGGCVVKVRHVSGAEACGHQAESNCNII